MKKYLLIIAILALFSWDALAQTNDLTSFNTERLQVNKVGMIVLGSWGAWEHGNKWRVVD